jgi:DNA-directed RNA polymerase subunit N (RpoN/RPB10)
MLYTTCPTCGLLFQKTEEYEQKKKIICDNPKLTKKEQETQISELLLSLNFRRYCCKMRVITFKQLTEIIH